MPLLPVLLLTLLVVGLVVGATYPVASNYFLQARATTLQTLLNSSQTLRLFSNNLNPTPANVLTDFTEATYAGYAGVSLNGQFGAPTKVQDGEYQIASGTYTFNGPATGSQTIYGWYISDGTGVNFSGVFPAPITMTSGVSFTLQISPQTWAYSVAV